MEAVSQDRVAAGIVGLLLGILTFVACGHRGAGKFRGDRARVSGVAVATLAVNYGALAVVPMVATLISLVTSRLTLLTHPEGPQVIWIRSLVFNILFYVNLALFVVLGSEFLLSPRKIAIRALQTWAQSSLWLVRVICGIRYGSTGPREYSAGRRSRREQAPVDVGDFRAAAARRRSGGGPQARAQLVSVLRLVHLQVPDDPGQARGGFHGAQAR